MSQIKSVIFDLDGTLVESAQSIILGIEYALQKSQMNPRVSINSEFIGPPIEEIFKKIVHVESDSLNKLIEDFKEYYDNFGFKEAKPYLGIENLLKQLNISNIKMYLATNKRLKPTLKIIEHLNWDNRFEAVYATDKLLNKKFTNKSILIKNLINEQSLEIQNTIYVGDTEEDIKFALENNINAIFVKWGYGKLKKITVGDKVKIASTTCHLLEIIKKEIK